jgi:hypothetical protein
MKMQDKINTFFYFLMIFFFSYTGINKLMKLDSFRMNILKTGVFSENTIKYLSVFVVSIELITVVLLLTKKRIGILLFTGLMITFTFYVTYLRANGLYEVCGCGGVLNGLEYKYHLMINLFFVIISSVLVVNEYKTQKNEK